MGTGLKHRSVLNRSVARSTLYWYHDVHCAAMPASMQLVVAYACTVSSVHVQRLCESVARAGGRCRVHRSSRTAVTCALCLISQRYTTTRNVTLCFDGRLSCNAASILTRRFDGRTVLSGVLGDTFMRRFRLWAEPGCAWRTSTEASTDRSGTTKGNRVAGFFRCLVTCIYTLDNFHLVHR